MFVLPQVNGHLDYMRQMDTILVAVGIPTKEVPGGTLSFALPQSVTVTEGTKGTEETEDVPDQTPSEQQLTDTETQTAEGATCTEESGDITDVTGDGWDIPDISDLLDSLNDTESSKNNFPQAPKEDAIDADTFPAFNSLANDVKEADPDNEHISWSWDDTNWTVEHTNKRTQPDL